jgi:hypothetical protein
VRLVVAVPPDILHIQGIEVLLALAQAVEDLPAHHGRRSKEQGQWHVRVVVLLIDGLCLRERGKGHVIVGPLQPCLKVSTCRLPGTDSGA